MVEQNFSEIYTNTKSETRKCEINTNRWRADILQMQEKEVDEKKLPLKYTGITKKQKNNYSLLLHSINAHYNLTIFYLFVLRLYHHSNVCLTKIAYHVPLLMPHFSIIRFSENRHSLIINDRNSFGISGVYDEQPSRSEL